MSTQPRLTMLVCAWMAAASWASAAELPVYIGEPSGQYLDRWLVAGPFPLTLGEGQTSDSFRTEGFYTDYLEPVGGETAPDFGDPAVAWQPYTAPGIYVDFDEALSKAGMVTGYAACAIEADAPTACVLAIGSNDGVRAWVNGEQVLDRPGPRGLKPDTDLVVAALQPGRNTLLFKVEERGGSWQLSCRLLPLNDPGVVERLPLYAVAHTDGGAPVLRYVQAPATLGTVVRGGEAWVTRRDEPDRELWRQALGTGTEVPIGVDASRFGDYTLHYAAEFAGGESRSASMPFSAGPRTQHVLFDEGATDYVIALHADASDSETWAAEVLQRELKAIGGAELPIVTIGDVMHEKAIVVGYGPVVHGLLSHVEAPADSDESFTYTSVGPSILIYGGKQRGTLYGVMDFLEREFGVRWYTPGVTHVPTRPRYAFVHVHHSDAPKIRVRNDFYFEAFNPIWAAHNRINGAMGYREQPGGVECYWSVHTFYPLMPPEEFFESHPEYYSLIDGKRIYERAQLCLTNPDVLRIITERIRERMRANPEYLIYSVSQNDWSNPCECDNCQAIAQREESEAGPVLAFVNQVAEAIEDEFPDKYIGTLAYQYTRKPPKTLKPRDNVVIRLCSIECCFAHPLTECPENASFVDDIRTWSKIAPHLYIWDYVVNFSHYVMPYPNFNVLAPNLQFFRDHNSIGIMEQAAYQSRGGEFAELRMYVISRLLWNPEAEVGPIIDDFMHGYYGRAGQYVRAYFDLLHGRLTPDTHIHLGLQPDDKLFSDDFVREAEALFDKAEIVADTEAIRHRVELARLPVMYLKCKRMPQEALYDGTYDRLKAIAERESVTHFAEAGAPHLAAFHEEMKAAAEAR